MGVTLMNTVIDERGQRFFSGIREFKQTNPQASWLELDQYIEKNLNTIFGDSLPQDQKNPLAAFGRACWH